MSSQMLTAPGKTTIAARLADLASTAIDPPDRERLRALTLANLASGVGYLGSTSKLIAAIRAGTAHRLGMRLHARTQDDFFPAGRVHVGAVTLAAALALAERTNDRLLECLAAGYRVMCSVSATYSRLAQRRGLRPTGMFGPMAAAATAGLALGLDRDGLANAIGLATTMTAGTNQAWISGSDEWLLEVGAAARAGVEAAIFTENGAKAAAEAFEGRAGWSAAFFGDVGGELLSRELRAHQAWIAEVALKPYPVSGIAQVPTHLACMAHESLAGSMPEHAEVRISEAAAAYPGSANRGPFHSRSDALMSVAFCVACGLAKGAVYLQDLERPSETSALRLMKRIEVVGDPKLDEEECWLSVRSGRRNFELTMRGEELLRPEWPAVSGDLHGLAARTQAPEDLVRQLHAELEQDSPHSTQLLDLIEP